MAETEATKDHLQLQLVEYSSTISKVNLLFGTTEEVTTKEVGEVTAMEVIRLPMVITST